jgi:hypothetical protein
MCLIIDTNVFHSVFSQDAKEYDHFGPVRNWLSTGTGKMVYGGDKYSRELRGGKFIAVLSELGRKGRLVKIPSASVNKYAAQLKIKVPEAAFDDEHLVAIVAVSKCCVICTRDKKAFPYLKRRELYPKGVKPPKIYQYKSNAGLCSKSHVVEVCR